MNVQKLTCIECPMGCEIEAGVEDGKAVYVKGNSCPRGKMYAENEVVCPMRVVTGTVRTEDGRMVPVKTEKPVKKSEMFEIMRRIKEVHPHGSIKIGDVLKENIAEGVNLIATGNSEKPMQWIIR